MYSTVALLHVRLQGVWGPCGEPTGKDCEMYQSPTQKTWAKHQLTLLHQATRLHFWVKAGAWARKHTRLEIKREELAKTTVEIHRMESRGGAVWLWSQRTVEWMLRATELQKLSLPGLGRLPCQGDTWRCATKEGSKREFRTSCCGWGEDGEGQGAGIPPAEKGLAPPLGWQWGAGARAREGDQD